ncbi:macrophage colony-stimulating factor 1 receptor [Pleurodeles waltl]|uniref:macrophage colony-stimulating factor 1 receptor n=1 Tax=Pleurodeles waltl TaxID=8319 RepID=UPI003709A86C
MGPVCLALIVAVCAHQGLGTPIIHPNLKEFTVHKGEPVFFYCIGNQSVTWATSEKLRKGRVSGTPTNSSVRIRNAVAADTGTYTCVYSNSSSAEQASLHIYVKDPKYPWLILFWPVFAEEGKDVLFRCLPTDPSVSNVTLVRDAKHLVPPESMSFDRHQGITLHKVRTDQKGDYVCEGVMYGEKRRSDTIELIVKGILHGPPTVKMKSVGQVRIVGEEFNICCETVSSVASSVEWNHTRKNGNITEAVDYQNGKWILTSTLHISRVELTDSGNFTCVARNSGGSSNMSSRLQVVDRGYVRLAVPKNGSLQLSLADELQMQVQIEAYPKILSWSWTHEMSQRNNISNLGGLFDQQNDSYLSTLTLYRPKESEVGLYTFFAVNSEANNSITFSLYNKPSVSASLNPFNNSKEMECNASGYPAPNISWHWCKGKKERCDEEEMLPLEGANTEVYFAKTISTLNLKDIDANATYMCIAFNVIGSARDSINVKLPDRVIQIEVQNKLFTPTLGAFCGLAALLLLLLILLLYKYKQKPKYEARWQIIDASEGNNYTFIDPTQLPYNEKLEFPRSKLTFGKTLGAGAFGKVLEATAHGLGKEDTSVKVAVKMLKPSAHIEEKEALMSELKIMSHLGQHENIVNLLGACTHGGPILVITEYCEHGDLLNFLRKKGDSFIIKDPITETLLEGTVAYKNICVDKKYTRSDSGFSSQCRESYLEMRPVRCDSTSKQDSALVAVEEEEEDTKPLMLFDLLQFSSQVAQGMAFLASKNCIHRDVAARNVLVTHGRLAKICDFGLARDIMNDSNYVVKGNARLPVKWMAPESIFDCIYTVQSDVWSYGILLWEIFSLGMSPYPGILVDGKFYKLVKQGYQMARPDFAPLEMYEIMRACWDLEPTHRPTFQQISDFIQHQISSDHNQGANLPCNAEGDRNSDCEMTKCDKESCEQGEASQPLLKSNNYQFC